MKNVALIIVASLMIVLSAFTKPAQESPVQQNCKGVQSSSLLTGFDFFRTHRQGKDGITSTWGFNAAQTITGFILERTYEDPADPYAYWETVALVPASGLRSYKATDTNVFPGFVSYRVTAVQGTTTVEVSNVSTVHIVSH
ncbi:MAG: hypothetical protein HYZ15_04365 [Sphingobacteriales bacterium]|nr:hypothetical protein [Sphingobacteriales bacterium]